MLESYVDYQKKNNGLNDPFESFINDLYNEYYYESSKRALSRVYGNYEYFICGKYGHIFKSKVFYRSYGGGYSGSISDSGSISISY